MKLTKKKEKERTLSEENLRLGEWTIRGKDYKLIGTYRNKNGSWSCDIRNQTTREVKTMGWETWREIVAKHENNA